MSSQVVDWPIWAGVVAKDVEAQRRYYRDVLGFSELRAGDGWVQFDMGWPKVFEVIAQSKVPQYEELGFQIGFAVDDIETAHDELVARGVEAATDIEGGPESAGYWCYFRDAEGNFFALLQRLGAPWPNG
jgi:predicted enzyme related to lactoylglutathione lyase